MNQTIYRAHFIVGDGKQSTRDGINPDLVKNEQKENIRNSYLIEKLMFA